MFSVVIPTYNPVKEWFQECLNSCAGVDEIVIGNDASKIYDPAEYKYPEGVETRFIHGEKNVGPFKMLNRIIPEAKGEWISTQADDDSYDKRKFPRLLNFIRGVPEDVDVVCYPCSYFGKRMQLYGQCGIPNFETIYKANNIYGSSFFRKRVFERLGGFQLTVAGDWDFWLRALKSGFKFAYFPEVSAYFRVSERSMFEDSLKKLGRKKIDRMVQENVDKWDVKK